MKDNHKVIAIPDLHMPFHDSKTLSKVLEIVEKEKPTHVVQLGDIADWYVFSRFARDVNYITPENEVKKTRLLVNKFWNDVREAAPKKAKFIQIIGNHDVRFIKKCNIHLPEISILMPTLRDVLNIPEFVKVLDSEREHHKIGNVIYTHGFLSKSEKHMAHFNSNVVHGHLHSASLISDGKRWSMNCGNLAATKKLPLQYTQSKVTRWSKALGIITNNKPQLILL